MLLPVNPLTQEYLNFLRETSTADSPLEPFFPRGLRKSENSKQKEGRRDSVTDLGVIQDTRIDLCCCSCCEVASVVSNSVRPHRRQPARLRRPWDAPGRNTGVGCRFLLHCVKVKSESEVAQSCLTLRDPMDCSPPGSSIHGIFQARVLEWGAIAFSNTEV